MPTIPADAIAFNLTGPTTALLIGGRGIVYGYSGRNLLAVASIFNLWDGPVSSGLLLASDSLPASGVVIPTQSSVGIQFVTELRIEIVSAANFQGVIWVVPETKIADALVTAQTRGGGVQAYLTNLLAPLPGLGE